MSPLAHGIDLVHCPRVQRIWSEHGDVFLQRVFTPAEREYCLRARAPAIHLSGRFAAKEAVLKMLGTGWGAGVRWTDVEILPDALSRPTVRLAGAAAEAARRGGITRILLSISHSGDYAIASAIGVGT